MKRLNKFLASVLVSAVFYLPVSASETDIQCLRRVSDYSLSSEVIKELDSRLEDFAIDLKGSIKNGVVEVFDGRTICGELGVATRIYRNEGSKSYYYFLMATVDSRVNDSDDDRYLILNSLCFSFDKDTFEENIRECPNMGGVVSDGRARGITAILDSDCGDFQVGIRYYDKVIKREDVLIYSVRISNVDGFYVFEGSGNGEINFEKRPSS